LQGDPIHIPPPGAEHRANEDAEALRRMLASRHRDWGAGTLTWIAAERYARLEAEAIAVLMARPLASVRALDFVVFWSAAAHAGLAPPPGATAAVLSALAHWAIPEDFEPGPAILCPTSPSPRRWPI